MAEAVEFGRVVDLTLGAVSGTELIADAAAGATSLVVDYAGDFDSAGGSLVLNGATIAYSEIVSAEGAMDPDVLVLVSPLAAAASAGDSVGLVAGGEPVLQCLLHVDLGDGDPVDIPIPFEQRALWSDVDVSTSPVPVVISADLERLVEVPGRLPTIDSGYILTPIATAQLANDMTIPTGLTTWTRVTDWRVDEAGQVSLGPAGVFRFTEGGIYMVTFGASFEPNESNARALRGRVHYADGTDQATRYNKIGAVDGVTGMDVMISPKRYLAGEGVSLEVNQTSGGDLKVLGRSGSGGTRLDRPTEVSFVRLAP